jgi:peptidoglycan/LPS O-acetylase OafA/YrhL
MGIGTAVVLFAAGAILYWAVDVDVPYVEDNTLGAILILAGALAAAVAVIVNTRRSETGTSVGTGIGLTAAGAVLFWAVDVDFPFIADGALGVILMVAGLITIAATLTLHWQDSRSRHVVQRRDPYSDGGRWSRRGDMNGTPERTSPMRQEGRYDPRYDGR